MKKLFALAVAPFALVAGVAYAAVTVEYHNSDSKKYEWPAKCSGASSVAKFDASTTGTYSIQGSGPCTVEAPGGTVTLKGGEKIEIKDGKITIK